MQIKQNSKRKNTEFNNQPILAGEGLTPKNPLERERRLKIHREQRRKRFPASRGLSRRGKNERPLLAGKERDGSNKQLALRYERKSP